MRCPKCHYISFGSVDRCRNCGYELMLAVEPPPLDLPIQSGDQPIGPLGDFVLSERGPAPQRSRHSPNPRALTPQRQASIGTGGAVAFRASALRRRRVRATTPRSSRRQRFLGRRCPCAGGNRRSRARVRNAAC